jgi:hypothetical protein
MSAPPPLQFEWDGEAMRPLHQNLADRHFVVGERYQLEVREDRSSASHRHYFSCIAEAHNNLPDHLVEQLPTSEHLRKYALIKTGHADRDSIVCASKAEALRVAAFVRPMNEFAVVTLEGASVTVWTAKSQSIRAMGKAAFEKSKSDVLDFVASLIGTDSATLQRHTNEAA